MSGHSLEGQILGILMQFNELDNPIGHILHTFQMS